MLNAVVGTVCRKEGSSALLLVLLLGFRGKVFLSDEVLMRAGMHLFALFTVYSASCGKTFSLGLEPAGTIVAFMSVSWSSTKLQKV